MGLHDEAKLDRKFVEFAKLMNIHLNHFPKHEKYGLALEIRRAAYAVYGYIVEGQKRYHKKTALSNLDVEHEKLRMLVRLAFELGYFEFKDGKREQKSPAAAGEHRYLALSRLVDELGRMIGGWIVVDRQLATREALSNLGFYGSPRVPSTANAGRDNFFTNPCLPRPLGNGARYAIDGDAMIVSPVVGLLGSGSPSAVIWRIVGAGDTAIQGHSKWARPHIGEECGERITPPRANHNADTAVPLEIIAALVVAPRQHVRPRGIFAWVLALCGIVALRLRSGFALLNPKAAAGSRRTSIEVSGLCNTLAATVTSAKPLRAAMLCVFGTRDSRQSPVFSSRKVVGFGHGFTFPFALANSTT